jgi:hypothetical protein
MLRAFGIRPTGNKQPDQGAFFQALCILQPVPAEYYFPAMIRTDSGVSATRLKEAGAFLRQQLDAANTWLRDPILPLGQYIPRCALLSAIPSLLVATLSLPLAPFRFNFLKKLPVWGPNLPAADLAIEIAGGILLVPLLAMGFAVFLVQLLRGTRLPAYFIPAVCALIFGSPEIHGRGLIAGLCTFWAFYCFTTVLVTADPAKLTRAWLIASAVHALHIALVLPTVHFVSFLNRL